MVKRQNHSRCSFPFLSTPAAFPENYARWSISFSIYCAELSGGGGNVLSFRGFFMLTVDSDYHSRAPTQSAREQNIYCERERQKF